MSASMSILLNAYNSYIAFNSFLLPLKYFSSLRDFFFKYYQFNSNHLLNFHKAMQDYHYTSVSHKLIIFWT